MSAGTAIALYIGPRRLCAIWAARSRKSLKIRGQMSHEIPDDLDRSDAQGFGRWIGEQLKIARAPRAAVTLVLPREQVVLKRLTLPTTESGELPEMTRLTLQRDLPFDIESAIIDVAPLEQVGASTTVLAVAVPGEIIQRSREIMKAAGLTIHRIALRSLGVIAAAETCEPAECDHAAVEANAQAMSLSPALVIDVQEAHLEMSLVDGGSLLMCRAAEVPSPQDMLAIADTIVTEARRTWMSHRGTSEHAQIAHTTLLGEQRVCEYASRPLMQMLGTPVRVLRSHPMIDAGDADLHHAWALAGALLEPSLGRAMIDLAHPRRAPDLHARRRQRWLAAAGLALVALLGAWTFARQDLHALQHKADELLVRQREMTPDNMRYLRDHYKLLHLQNWESSRVDWLEHAQELVNLAPDSRSLVFDSFAGTLDFRGVKFDSRTNKWSVDQSLTIAMDGEASNRETADAFRASLVQSAQYETATQGADAGGGKRMPFGFTYRLRTRNPGPQTPGSEPARAVAPKVAASGGQQR